MTGEQFLAEAKEYIDSVYSRFLTYQDVVNDIYDRFSEVCKSNGIPFFYAFGGLIGLVRDKGNIPWDYDIDVIVPYDARAELIAALKKDLGDGYYYVYKDNMKNYPTSCLRVCKKGCSYMAFHMDVFFIFGVPSEEKKRARFIRRVFWTYYAREAKYLSCHLDERKLSRVHRLGRKLLSAVRYPIPRPVLDALEESIYRKYPLERAERCMIFYPITNTYATDCFRQAQELAVGDRVYPVPTDCETFLRDRYGDFMRYLPIDDRFGEFYSMSQIVEERQKYYLEKLAETDRASSLPQGFGS